MLYGIINVRISIILNSLFHTLVSFKVVVFKKILNLCYLIGEYNHTYNCIKVFLNCTYYFHYNELLHLLQTVYNYLFPQK
jgi:hypothetical protein